MDTRLPTIKAKEIHAYQKTNGTFDIHMKTLLEYVFKEKHKKVLGEVICETDITNVNITFNSFPDDIDENTEYLVLSFNKNEGFVTWKRK